MQATQHPVVVCVRDPDFDAQIDVYPGGAVRVIEIDLGGHFDGPKHFNRRDPAQLDWVATHVRSVSDLAVAHPARVAVCKQLQNLDAKIGAAPRTDPNQQSAGQAYGLTVGELS